MDVSINSLLTEPALHVAPHSSRPPHYRPFSTIYQQADTASRNRTSVFGPSFGNMVFNKKDDFISPRPLDNAPHQSRFNLLKKKKSLASLFQPPSIDIIAPSVTERSSSASSSSSSIMPLTPPLATPTLSQMSRFSLEMETCQPPLDPDAATGYIATNVWRSSDFKVKLHPYPKEAIYLRSYQPMDLDNDRYTDLLLRRLYPKDSPTFHEYGRRPPANVLDVGCGAGHWMQFAAAKWPRSSFTGFDLVDTLLPSITSTGKISIVRGNFTMYTWPWPPKSFDLIRLCDISSAIPIAAWNHVLRECTRVLKANGRIELIDDQTFFPYANGTEPTNLLPVNSSMSEDLLAHRRLKGQSFFDIDEDSEEDSEPECELFDSDSVGSQCSTEESTSVSGESPSSSPDLKNNLLLISVPSRRPPSRPIPPIPEISELDATSLPSSHSWSTRVAASKDMEEVYTRLLEHNDVHPHPSEFLQSVFNDIFGEGAWSKRSIHIKLGPPGLCPEGDAPPQTTGDSGSDDEDEWQTPPSATTPTLLAPHHAKRNWMKKNLNRKESSESDYRSSTETRSSHESVDDHVPECITAKAASRLGIAIPNTPPTPTGHKSIIRRPPPISVRSSSFGSVRSSLEKPSSSQPYGLIVWPRTFLPMSAAELEMHTLKHMHNLIGTKVALSEYVASCVDENGKPYVSRKEFTDALWDYEEFGRARLNWTSDFASSKQPASIEPVELPWALKSVTLPPAENRPRNHEGPYRWNDLIHIRSIRVFSVMVNTTKQSPEIPVVEST